MCVCAYESHAHRTKRDTHRCVCVSTKRDTHTDTTPAHLHRYLIGTDTHTHKQNSESDLGPVSILGSKDQQEVNGHHPSILLPSCPPPLAQPPPDPYQ